MSYTISQCSPSEETFHLIKHWIVCHINRPIQGFEHKKNADGTTYTREQQLSATQFQVMSIADYFLTHGKSYEYTLKVLQVFVK